MKRLSTLLLSLFAFLALSAQSMLPEFSTESEPVWCSVQFKTGEALLSDGSGGKMVTVDNTTDNDNVQFQFIGTQKSFKMKSRAGYWVTFGDSYFTTTQTAADATTLTIIKGTESNYWEIKRASSTLAMNQWTGAGSGKNLGEYNVGDTNNQLYFNVLTARKPTFSTADGTTERYYFVVFKRGGYCWGVSTNGTDNCIRTYTADPVDGQLWKLVGTESNFQLVNKAGQYINVSSQSISTTQGGVNNNPLRTSDSPEAQGFSLVDNESSFEIVANAKGSNVGCNLWGAPDGDNTIGLYTIGDQNNQVTFVNPEDMTYDDYKTIGITGYTPAHDLTLWYTEPATTAKLYSGGQGYSNWMEYSLPLGDGQFGASLFGGVATDEIQFNEKTLWSGRSTDLTGGGNGYGVYQNFGSVYAEDLTGVFDYSTTGAATDYYRQLDLTTATGTTSFKDKNGVTYTREYIASHPARVVAARYSASEAGKISLRFTMESGSMTAATTYAENGGTFSGKLDVVSYNARFKVVPTGGTITTTDEGIEVRNADEVLLILAGGTDFDAYASGYFSNTATLSSTIEARVNDAAAQTWNELYAAQQADYKSYFDRVAFNLEGTANTVPTNELIDTYNGGKGANALMLERLYFAYGRYLEIGSSRGVDLPSNLQGIWNNMSNPAWNADIHSNINVQMNYWPAEPTNLSEMHVPFLNYIWNMAVNHGEWKSYAQSFGGQSRGWVTPTENNIFGGGTKFVSTYVVANAWYCSHLWQHYRYTLDKEYLKKVFPAMLSATQFWIDRLKLDTDGTYVAPNEWSPEQGPTEDGVAHAQQLVAELFDNTLAAIDVLGQDEAGITTEDLAKLKLRNQKLDRGLHTETYTGNWGTSAIPAGTKILREWKKSSYTVGADGHRHMSHLMCMYPFSQVFPGTSLFEAAVNSMKLRGDGATGWSMGWKINLWARALDGDHARKILNNALRHANGGAGVFYNLFDSHPPFQIDGNFGACSGIAEMIMQSNSDTIRILPALPTAWADGSMKGLKAVGDFTVDTEWKEGAATKVTITSNQGQTIPVYYKDLARAAVSVNGVVTKDFPVKDGVAILNGAAGTVYTFDFVNIPTSVDKVAGTTDTPVITTKGRQVSVAGTGIARVNVYDLQGRQLTHTTQTVFTLAPAKGTAFIIEAVTEGGTKVVKKVVMD